MRENKNPLLVLEVREGVAKSRGPTWMLRACMQADIEGTPIGLEGLRVGVVGVYVSVVGKDMGVRYKNTRKASAK